MINVEYLRLLIDGAGAWLTRNPSFAALRDAGGRVAMFHPLFGFRTPGRRNLRNHRKLVIADDSRLWSGGRNVAAEYFSGTGRAEPWVDLSFDLSGAVATAAAHQYDADWPAVEGRVPRQVRSAEQHTPGPPHTGIRTVSGGRPGADRRLSAVGGRSRSDTRSGSHRRDTVHGSTDGNQ